MSTQQNGPRENDQHVFTEVELRTDGILWMLNSAIFHPRGLALGAGVGKDAGKFFLQGDGDEVWIFEEDLAQDCKDAFDAMIERHMERVRR